MRLLSRCFVIITLFIFVSSHMTIFAVDIGATTNNIPEDRIKRINDNIELTLLTENRVKNALECFDVNDDGMVAVGYSDDHTKIINIYSFDGTFQYGYEFKCSGAFGIEWYDDLLAIYFVRGDIVTLVDSEGEIKSIFEVPYDYENRIYEDKNVFVNKRTKGSFEYKMTNTIRFFNIFGYYSQLVRVDDRGNEVILYDVSHAHNAKVITMIVLVIFFVSIVFVNLIKLISNPEKYNKKNIIIS